MKQQIKKSDSVIVTGALQYPKHRPTITDTLAAEQNLRCAYTETHLGTTDKREIEHFNPTLKGKAADGYENWFLVKAKWNNDKSTKWTKYQPILHPTAADFNERILYDEGSFIARPNDREAHNLIKLLKLDDLRLVEDRKLYIERRREEMDEKKMDAHTFFHWLLKIEPPRVFFIRAIEEEFGITVQFG
jgi:hypothetical protein